MEFSDLVVSKFEKLKDVFIRKNHDYGNSVEIVPTLAPNVSPEEAVRVRISDKINRLMSLLSNNNNQVNESIIDTMEDTAVYFIILSCLWEKYNISKQLCTEDNEDTADTQAGRLHSISLDKFPLKDISILNSTMPFCLIHNGIPTGVHRWMDVIDNIYSGLHLTESDKDIMMVLQKGYYNKTFVGRSLEELDNMSRDTVLNIGDNFYVDTAMGVYLSLNFIKKVMDTLNKRADGIVVYYISHPNIND